jgi:hypothetical protein
MEQGRLHSYYGIKGNASGSGREKWHVSSTCQPAPTSLSTDPFQPAHAITLLPQHSETAMGEFRGEVELEDWTQEHSGTNPATKGYAALAGANAVSNEPGVVSHSQTERLRMRWKIFSRARAVSYCVPVYGVGYPRVEGRGSRSRVITMTSRGWRWWWFTPGSTAA